MWNFLFQFQIKKERTKKVSTPDCGDSDDDGDKYNLEEMLSEVSWPVTISAVTLGPRKVSGPL